MVSLTDTYDREQPTSRANPSLPSPTGFAFDLFAFAAVAIILALVMQTSASFQDQLVLHYGEPTLHALYTTHFVHNSMAHLRGNLTAYGVIVPLTYLLCLRADRHKEFRVGFLAVLFVLPPIISVVSLVGLDVAVEFIIGVRPHVQSSRGFSALDGAFVGLLMVASRTTSERRAGARVRSCRLSGCCSASDWRERSGACSSTRRRRWRSCCLQCRSVSVVVALGCRSDLRTSWLTVCR
ncbi:hypothetical protein [Haladaptatus sp. DYF46]|uniref:hypothetical protein n=1 Tax=Haladaptatus sp. DYF46 TaxID=2886041 RepID=UPI001E364EE7|nr:hypothetical protein [Haladaptatus sp. DYF46]